MEQKIGISVGSFFRTEPEDLIHMVADLGFDAVSPVWSAGETMTAMVEHARKRGLIVQSLHAASGQEANIWSDDPEIGAYALQDFQRSLLDCRKLSIPILVVHTWRTFCFSGTPSEAGLRRFAQLVDQAAEFGIQIAFENMQGEKYLYALMDYFRGNPNAGICWDSGHELCYSRGMPILADLGDRLIMTHLNDNLGVTSEDGSIASKDDLHYLPYDGVGDWERNVRLLQQAKKQEILNFEVKRFAKEYQRQNPKYLELSLEQYLQQAYFRARKIADMYAREGKTEA